MLIFPTTGRWLLSHVATPAFMASTVTWPHGVTRLEQEEGKDRWRHISHKAVRFLVYFYSATDKLNKQAMFSNCWSFDVFLDVCLLSWVTLIYIKKCLKIWLHHYLLFFIIIINLIITLHPLISSCWWNKPRTQKIYSHDQGQTLLWQTLGMLYIQYVYHFRKRKKPHNSLINEIKTHLKFFTITYLHNNHW